MKKKVRKKRILLNVRNKKRETRRRHVLALYRQGYSCNKIAVKLDASPHTIACDLHAMGKHVKTQKTKEKRNAALIKDRCEGKTIASLAKKYKISEDRVNEIITNYNKVAENPVPDFRILREIRRKNQQKPKCKKVPPKSTISSSTEKTKSVKKQYAERRLQRIIAMYNNGSTLQMIGKQCNLTANRIYQLLRKANVITALRPKVKKSRSVKTLKRTKAKTTRKSAKK
jgi:Mor family transcriptional regulator